MGKGYAEGPALEERLAALERDDASGRRDRGRLAVYGGTPDQPARHFIGWADELDADELFASGRAFGIQLIRRPGG